MSCRFDPADRIRFVAGNPKRPGSKAFERFASYSCAKNVKEALRLGAWLGDLKNDEEKGFLKRGQPRANVKNPKVKVKNLKVKVATNTSTTSGLALSYVKDVPLSPVEGEEGLKLWQEMQDAGWRRCEFKFLAGVKKGCLYRRFVQPPAKKESSKGSAPLGKSINGGFPTAIKLYAKLNVEAKKMVQKVLNQKAEMSKLGVKHTQGMTREERGKCIQAYRELFGYLRSTAQLLKRHPGWQEEAEAFISPDGERFVKSMSANNLLHVLGDVEAYIAKQLLLNKASATAKSNVTAMVAKKIKTKVETKTKGNASAKHLRKSKHRGKMPINLD